MSKDKYHSDGCGCVPALFKDMIENAGLELSRRDFIKGTTVACGMFAAGGVVISALSGSKAMAADNKADTIYHGGSILSMVKDGDRTEALAVKGDRILAVGALSGVMAYKGTDTKLFAPM